jgi:hypothetical protein
VHCFGLLASLSFLVRSIVHVENWRQGRLVNGKVSFLVKVFL